jgi:hypothetical protein
VQVAILAPSRDRGHLPELLRSFHCYRVELRFARSSDDLAAGQRLRTIPRRTRASCTSLHVHLLGFRHEHIRSEGQTCSIRNPWSTRWRSTITTRNGDALRRSGGR